MKLKGRVWKFGDNVNTDDIISAKYLSITDANELGKHCLEAVSKDFNKKVAPGDVLVGGKNFGCGSSREHAPLAIKGCGIACVIAGTFARIFYRNCINMGLPILECAGLPRDVKDGDEVEVDLALGALRNLTQNKGYMALPFSEFMKDLIMAGGLMEWVKRRCIR